MTVGIQDRRIQHSSLAAEAGERRELPRLGIAPGDPRQVQSAAFHRRTAHGRQQFVGRNRLGNRLVHLAERIVQPIQTPQFYFGPVPMQGDFEDRLQLVILAGRNQVAPGLRQLGSLEGGFVRVGGEKDHGQLKPVPELLRGRDAVHLTLQADVHEHQVRPLFLGQGQGLKATAAARLHGVPELPQTRSQVGWPAAFRVYDQHMRWVHRSIPAGA